mmetsp:Transcript_6481/g.11333  ORF Transcript_6481/g.11333 Transcript_6481/m.11333 type:complete len:656 (-) Transcript_6481:27-1994(-)
MINSNTNEAPGIPQYLVEPVLNLYRAGTPPQTISQSFNLTLEAVITFLSSQQNDPALNFFQALQRKSQDFRCPITSHLMVSPVVASDGKVYEETSLRNWLKTTKVSPVTGEKLSGAKPFPLLDLKQRIKEFCHSALIEIDPILSLDLEDDAPVVMVAECLAVLISSGETVAHKLERLSILSPDKQKVLTFTLSKRVSNENKAKLLMDLSPFKGFGAASVQVLKSLLEEREEDYLSDDEFSCLTDLVMRPNPSEDLVSLAFIASKFCDGNQLERLQRELSSVATPGSLELCELKLRRAELSVYEKKVEDAKEIVGEMKKSSRLRRSVLEFYDRVGWVSEKKGFIEESLASSLSTLGAGEPSAHLLEALENLWELSKSFTPLKDKRPSRKNRRRRRAPCGPERLYSFTGNSGSLHWIDLESKEAVTKTIEGYTFPNHPNWALLPSGNLFFIGGNLASGGSTKACVEVDTEEFTITQKPEMSSLRYASGCAYLSGKVFAIAGYNSAMIKACEFYDIENEEWEAMPDLPEAGYCQAVVGLEQTNSLLVTGGYDKNSGWLKKVFEFSLDEMEWSIWKIELATSTFSPFFQVDRDSTEVYICLQSSVVKLDAAKQKQTAINVKPFALTGTVTFGQSAYSDGTLYYSSTTGAPVALNLGPLD